MKKSLLLILALLMTLGIAGCGGGANDPAESSEPAESVSLVDVTTEQGISLKLPSDMTLQENSGAYANLETGDVASFGVEELDAADIPLSEWTEEDVLATYQSKYEEVVIESFDNDGESLVTQVSLKTPKGNAITMVVVMITDGETNYVVNLGYGTDNTDGSLAQNIIACVESISI